MRKEKKGITLIALVITIIVLFILAGVTIATLTGENGVLTQATSTQFKTELTAMKEQVELYQAEKQAENLEFDGTTLSANQNILSYNTQGEETGNIYTIIPDLKDKYKEEIEISKGQLIFISQDIQKLKWAKEAGIEINPYHIVDGELISSDNNLLLMDNTGKIVIPNGVTKIGNGAFNNVTGLKTIIIPGTVKEIGDYAFAGNSDLENIVLEEGIEKIGSFAFQYCTSLKEITLPNTVTSIGDTCFYACSSLKQAKLSTNLKFLPYRLFSSCTQLKEVEIPEGVESLGPNVWENCSLIEEIAIPKTVKSISGSTFDLMSGLKRLIINENPYYTFQEGLLMSADQKVLYQVISDATDIMLNQGIEEIKAGAFYQCKNVETIQLSKQIKTIEGNPFFQLSKLKQVNVEENNPYFKSINGNLYTYNLATGNLESLIIYCSNEPDVVLPDGLKELGTYCFYPRTTIKTITLPKSMERLLSFSVQFNQCSLQELYIPKNVNLLSSSSFDKSIQKVTIDENNPNYQCQDGISILDKTGKKLVAVIGFADNYVIPDTVEIIGSAVFYTKKMKTMVIPSHVKRIDLAAFDACWDLEKIQISSEIQEIQTGAFARCDKLKEIVIDKRQGEIAGAPWGCPYGDRAVKWKE